MGTTSTGDGIFVENATLGNTIGGAGAAGNLISGNTIGINLDNASSNAVYGNLIGTDALGTGGFGNAAEGILVKNSSTNQIGGAGALRNVIADNASSGILMTGSSTANVVEGNYIGVDISGSVAVANAGNGVHITSLAASNRIGSTVAGLENTIAYNGLDGLFLASGTGNAIFSNVIHSNDGLGIDLGNDGVAPNDPGDSDTGANGLQNYPVLSGANSSANTVSGDLNSTPTTTFRVEIFRNSACDPSDFGEGEIFAAFVNVTTDFSGDASFNVSIPVSSGEIFTATATDPTNNTSEFSQCVAANDPPELAAIGNQSVNEGDIELVTVTANDPDGTIPIFSDQNMPAFATLTDNFDGSATLTLSPSFTDGGSYPGIVIIASDGLLTDEETIAISVNEVNRAPVVTPIGNQSVNEGDVEVVNVSATDPDGDIPTLSASNLPSFAIFTPLPGGTGQLALSPTFSDAGSYSGIVITATDPIAPNPTGSETIAISVNAVNQAPILNAIGNQSVNEGDVEVVTVTASDPDGPPQPLLSAANLPGFATFLDLGGGNGTLTLAPTFSDGGSYSGIVITAKDATDPTSLVSETIAISANEINPPPVLDPVGDQQLDEGAILDVAVSASDPDGTIPLLTAANLPAFASFTTGGGGTGNLHLEPGFQDAGVYPNVELIATDAVDPALTSTELITITVNEALNLSVITGAHNVLIGKNANITGDILSGDGVKILKGKKKKPGEIDGSIVAEGNAAIHKDNHVSGDVTLGGKLKVGKRVVIDGTVTEHAEVLPVVLPFIQFPVDGRGRNITVKKKKTLDLPPNDEDHPTYGRLKAQHHATLILHSGTYNFSDRFVMRHHGQLVFELDAGEPVTINIKRGLHMGHHTEVTIHNGDASDVLFNITGPGILNEEHKDDEDDDDWEGEDEKDAKLKDTKRDRDRHPRLASRILHKSVFQGTIVSPHGKVRVGHHTSMKGALIAYKVKLSKHVEFSGVLAEHLEFSGPPEAAKLVAGFEDELMPEDFEFPPNYPNPFNPETTIPFAVPDLVYVSIEIYDILGQRVKTLVSDEMNAGTYSVVWNGRDDAGRAVASGVYLYRIIAGEFVAKRRLLLVR